MVLGGFRSFHVLELTPYIALTQFMALLDVPHFSIAVLTILLPGFALLQTVVSKRNVNVCK